MQIEDIVEFWSKQEQNSSGHWSHPDDTRFFEKSKHTFNLDFPVSPYVGDIANAPVIILGANAGYDANITPEEFQTNEMIQAYLARVSSPSKSDWQSVSSYYYKTNYGPLIGNGQAALINACPYRSPKISKEPDNKRLLNQLPSTQFCRKWLIEVVLPLASSSNRLVVAKRFGLWNLPESAKRNPGVTFDPAPVSPQITRKPWAIVQEFLTAG